MVPALIGTPIYIEVALVRIGAPAEIGLRPADIRVPADTGVAPAPIGLLQILEWYQVKLEHLQIPG